MSSHYNHPDRSQRESQRPTLPHIHELFGHELSQPPRPHGGVAPPFSSSPAYSPSAPFSQLSLRPEDPSAYGGERYQSRYPPAPIPYAQAHPSISTPGRSRTPSASSDQYRQRPSPSPPTHRDRSASSPAPYPYTYAPETNAGHWAHSHHRTHQGEPTHTYQPGQSSGLVQSAPVAGGPATHPYGAPGYGTREVVLNPATGSLDQSTSSRYECSYCGKGFTRPSSLRIHLHSHTGERPYACTFEGCDRTFSVQSNMRRHARTHTQGNQAPDLSEEDESPSDASPQPSGSGAGRRSSSA